MNCLNVVRTINKKTSFVATVAQSSLSVAETTKTTSETANKEAQGEQSVIQTQVTKEIEEVTTNSKEQAFYHHQNINQSVVNQNDTHEHIETPLEQGTQSNNKDTFYEMKQFL